MCIHVATVGTVCPGSVCLVGVLSRTGRTASGVHVTLRPTREAVRYKQPYHGRLSVNGCQL